jgi:hypothetical protein
MKCVADTDWHGNSELRSSGTLEIRTADRATVRTFSVQLLSRRLFAFGSSGGFAGSFFRSSSGIARSFGSFAGSFRSSVRSLGRFSSSFLSSVCSSLFLLRASCERQGNCESGKNHFGVHENYHPDMS